MPRGNGNVPKKRKRSLSVSLPIKPISTNDLYAGRKTRSWHYKKFRRFVFQYLDENYKEPVSLSGNLVLEIDVGFSSPLSDASNSVKGLEDVLAEFYGFNDRQIVTLLVNKYLVNKGEEYTNVRIKGTKKNIDMRSKRNVRKRTT